MRVLQVINNLGPGGAEKLLELIVPLMNEKKDVKVDVLLLTDKGNVHEESLIGNNVNIKIIEYNNLYDPRNIFKLVNYIKKGDYDVVHSHLFPTQYWVAGASMFFKNKKIKFITTEHSTVNRRREQSLLQPLEKWIYSQYDNIISISNATKVNLIKWLNPNEEKSERHVVIENGVDLGKIRTAKPYDKKEIINKEYLKENTKVICMVGRFSEAKDQPTLIKALKKLSDNYHLIFMGDGALVNKSIQLAANLGISDRTHFLGFRTDMERVLKTSDIIVLSTHWEGLSLASIEALASGKPFIASNVAGVKEVVKNRGLLFEEGNVSELVSHINNLMINEELYRMVVQRSLEASKDYDIHNMVDELVQIYKT